MNEKISIKKRNRERARIYVWGFIGGLLVTLLVVFAVNGSFWLFAPHVVEVEPKPQPLEDSLSFYVARLRAMNYTVHEQKLSTNDFKEVNFNQFLWILQQTNSTECYYSPAGYLKLFDKEPMIAKLWVQVDGVYWEVRFP